jgi:hypothetical protein
VDTYEIARFDEGRNAYSDPFIRVAAATALDALTKWRDSGEGGETGAYGARVVGTHRWIALVIDNNGEVLPAEI